MPGSTAAMPCSTPLMFTSIMRSRSSTLIAAGGDSGMTPALLTITSTRPQASTAAPAKVATSARSVTSSARLRAVPPAASMSATSASSRAVRRAPSIGFAPRAASSRAMPSPMPLETRARCAIGRRGGCAWRSPRSPSASSRARYLVRAGTPARPRELVGHRCIGWRPAPAMAPYRWEFAEGGRELGVAVSPEITTNDMGLMVRLAEAGAGITFGMEDTFRPAPERGTPDRAPGCVPGRAPVVAAHDAPSPGARPATWRETDPQELEPSPVQ